jgi:hypothetical protein
MPRWVKVFGALALLLLVVIAVMLLSGGNHGPGRHTGDVRGQIAVGVLADSRGAG